jgi:tRNA(Ile)-lysidine synthase
VSDGRRVDKLLVQRFAGDLERLVPPGARLGIAVSGGADSLGLLLLACAARPTDIEAATVDHGLRSESAAEAAMVTSVCGSAGVRHTILKPDWRDKPITQLQEKARAARYGALGRWAGERRISAILTGHHREDQAETLLMRLSRGAGVRGLAAMRPSGAVPGHPSIKLLRPVLDWSRADLNALCVAAGILPVEDPSNHDEGFERVRVRKALETLAWLDAEAVARSAANLAQADEALDWTARQEWNSAVSRTDAGVHYTPVGPVEIRRRVVGGIIAELATEGDTELRGRELDRVLDILTAGASGTLRGVLCSGGQQWSFRPAPPRSRLPANVQQKD